jgi:hypothetical protein
VEEGKNSLLFLLLSKIILEIREKASSGRSVVVSAVLMEKEWARLKSLAQLDGYVGKKSIVD